MEYDPQKEVSPQEWLDLDEQERIILVEKHHRARRIRLPKLTLHATFHVVVENQLAEGEAVVIQTLARLRDEGLDRHDAIHAIGSVLSGEIFEALTERESGNGYETYQAKLQNLTADGWRAG